LAFVVFRQVAAGNVLLCTLPLLQDQAGQNAAEGNGAGHLSGAPIREDAAAAAAASVVHMQRDSELLRQQLDLHHQTNHLQLQLLHQQHEISLADLNHRLDVVTSQLQQQHVLLQAHQRQIQQQPQPAPQAGIGAVLNFDHVELVLIDSLTPGMCGGAFFFSFFLIVAR
jgi:hypothetical protein